MGAESTAYFNRRHEPLLIHATRRRKATPQRKDDGRVATRCLSKRRPIYEFLKNPILRLEEDWSRPVRGRVIQSIGLGAVRDGADAVPASASRSRALRPRAAGMPQSIFSVQAWLPFRVRGHPRKGKGAQRSSCPSSGDGLTSGVRPPKDTGQPGILNGPAIGCSIVCMMPRRWKSTCSVSSMVSKMAPAGTPAPFDHARANGQRRILVVERELDALRSWPDRCRPATWAELAHRDQTGWNCVRERSVSAPPCWRDGLGLATPPPGDALWPRRLLTKKLRGSQAVPARAFGGRAPASPPLTPPIATPRFQPPAR
jgi:hypothetical protein